MIINSKIRVVKKNYEHRYINSLYFLKRIFNKLISSNSFDLIITCVHVKTKYKTYHKKNTFFLN